MYRFIKERDMANRFETTSVSMEVSSGADLSDLLVEFSYFLKGCGFHFEGDLDFVEPVKVKAEEINEDVIS